MEPKTRKIVGKLTVVIRDISPLVLLEEPIPHRTVQIQLTPEQIDQLALWQTGTDRGRELYEEISTCFIEE